MWDDNIFFKALFFATKAHENQKMKYPEDMPYSAHIYGVLQCAIKYSLGDNDINWNLLVAAALLHDVIEDTIITFEDVYKEFGKEVANGVLALSKDKTNEKEKQMLDCIEKIKKQPKEIAIVKMADRLFNIRKRVPVWSKEKQEYYKQEAQLICNELGYASITLKNALQLAIDKF